MKESTTNYIKELSNNYEKFRGVKFDRETFRALDIKMYKKILEIKGDFELLANIFEADIPIISDVCLSLLIDSGRTEKEICNILGWE